MNENKEIKQYTEYDPYTDKFIDTKNLPFTITSNKTLSQEELNEIFYENYCK